METLGRFPGFAGLFVSCILSASLSTISSGVNSMATVIIEDIYKRLPMARPISSECQATASKLLCKFHFSALLELLFLDYSNRNRFFHHVSRIHRVLRRKQHYYC